MEEKKEAEKQRKNKQVGATKVYYVEEQVKMLSEIIAQADPVLGEMCSLVHSFQKLVTSKKSSR